MCWLLGDRVECLDRQSVREPLGLLAAGFDPEVDIAHERLALHVWEGLPVDPGGRLVDDGLVPQETLLIHPELAPGRCDPLDDVGAYRLVERPEVAPLLVELGIDLLHVAIGSQYPASHRDPFRSPLLPTQTPLVGKT